MREPRVLEHRRQLLHELRLARRVPDHRHEVDVLVAHARDALEHLQVADLEVVAAARHEVRRRGPRSAHASGRRSTRRASGAVGRRSRCTRWGAGARRPAPGARARPAGRRRRTPRARTRSLSTPVGARSRPPSVGRAADARRRCPRPSRGRGTRGGARRGSRAVSLLSRSSADQRGAIAGPNGGSSTPPSVTKRGDEVRGRHVEGRVPDVDRLGGRPAGRRTR